MIHFLSLPRSSILFSLLILSSSLSAQNLVNKGATITVETGTTLTIEGDLFNESTGILENNGEIEIKGTITNNSITSLTTGMGSVWMHGSVLQKVIGSKASNFYHLKIENPQGLQLEQGINIEAELEMTDGNIDLNGQNIVLSEIGELVGETNDRRIFGSTGEISTTRVIGMPNGSNIAGLGVAITSTVDMGSTLVKRGHSIMNVGAGMSIERYFNIIPENNANLDADFRFYYFPNELAGQDPNILSLWRKNIGAQDWTPAGGLSDVSAAFVEQSGINQMALWTLSADGTSGLQHLLPTLSFSCYPNPNSSGENLFIEGLEPGKYEVILYDMRGKEVMEFEKQVFAVGNDFKFQLPDLPEGVYSLQLTHPQYRPTVARLIITN